MRNGQIKDGVERKIQQRVIRDVEQTMFGVRLEVNMKLRQIRLQCDFPQPREHVDVITSQQREEIPHEYKGYDGHERKIRMQWVIGIFI